MAPRPMLLPGDVASWLYNYQPARFHSIFGTEHLREYWSHIIEAEPPWFQDHPAAGRIRATGGAQEIPVGLFGDEGGVGKHKAILVYHWRALCSQETSTRFNRLPIFVQSCRNAVSKITEVPLLKEMVHNFNAAACGHHPFRDHEGNVLSGRRGKQAGQLLAGGFRFIFVQYAVGWKHAVDSCNFAHSYKPGDEICHMCLASRTGPMNFMNFAAESPCFAR